MMISKGRVVWPAVLALTVLLAGGGYALGRANVNPFRQASLAASPGASPADSIEIALSLYKRCGSLGGEAKTDCYSKPLDSLALRGDVRVAMGALAHLGILDIDVKRDGHVFAHGIGIAGANGGGDIAKIFAMCDESNQSGCYHGVIQAYFASAKKIGPPEVNALCDAFRGPQADRWIRFQCVHGTGHGLEMIYAHNLPKALAGCDFLSDDWDRKSCYGGAFMENIVNVTMPKHPAHDLEAGMDMSGMRGMDHGGTSTYKAIDPADPLYPCSTMADRYLVSCYEMQTSVMLYLNNGNMAATARTCDTAPVRMRYVCYQSMGRDISSYAMQDHAKSIEMCSLGKPEYQPWCYVGVVKNFVDLNARADDGLAFCRKLSGEANKMKCYEAVGEEIGTLRNDPEPRRALCQPTEPAYLDACLFGARVRAAAPELLAKLNAAASGG
jgi:hypothetical protein